MLPNDFPEWFSTFLEEQLGDVPTFREQPSYDIDNLTIAYIRLWSIFEIYIKILRKLHEKRSALKEINAKIKHAEEVASNVSAWITDAKKVASAYSDSIRSGAHIDIDENVAKLSAQIKTITVSKYSVRKSDIALMPLPTAKDIDKSCAEFEFNGSKLSNLLEPTNSESKFYKTRNTIAHEGKSDIQLRNFILMRINPLREVVDIIAGHLNAT